MHLSTWEQYIPYDCCPKIMSVNSPDEFLFGWSSFIPSGEGFHKKFVGLFSDQFQTSQSGFLLRFLICYIKFIYVHFNVCEKKRGWISLSVPNHEFYCICNLGIKKIVTWFKRTSWWIYFPHGKDGKAYLINLSYSGHVLLIIFVLIIRK